MSLVSEDIVNSAHPVRSQGMQVVFSGNFKAFIENDIESLTRIML